MNKTFLSMKNCEEGVKLEILYYQLKRESKKEFDKIKKEVEELGFKFDKLGKYGFKASLKDEDLKVWDIYHKLEKEGFSWY